MGLGEAFVNVRGNLTPFAKDLEKGINAILKKAEQRLAADTSIGNALKESMRRSLGEGVSQGLEDGWRKGTERGAKVALTGAEKFLAALGDFVDDGLSAIPAKVKAALVIGVVAAAVAVAPLLASALAAAITSGASLAITGIGIVFASQLKPVNDQFRALGRDLLAQLREAATVFVTPLMRAAVDIKDAFSDSSATIKSLFAEAAASVSPLSKALANIIRTLLPIFQQSLRNAKPLIAELARSMESFARQVGAALLLISEAGPKATVGLRDLFTLIGFSIMTLAIMVRTLAEVYFWLRAISLLATGQAVAAFNQMQQGEADLITASRGLNGELGNTSDSLSDVAYEAYAADNAISTLLATQLSALDANIAYEEALDRLTESIKENGRVFDIGNEKGRQNLLLVRRMITAAAEIRDAEILRARETGRSIDDINAAYQRQIAGIEAVIGKNALQDKSLKEIIETAKQVPSEVGVEVKTPGLAGAIHRFENLRTAIRNALEAGAKSGSGLGAGLRTAPQYAMGAIVSRPTTALIAEAGYAEAVIPDPAVKPRRALELSNQFGLTSLIASTLGAAANVVNVYLGNEKLTQFVDYRVGFSNQMNAMAMAQGPRGA